MVAVRQARESRDDLAERLSERLRGTTLRTSDVVVRELVSELSSNPKLVAWLANDDLAAALGGVVGVAGALAADTDAGDADLRVEVLSADDRRGGEPGPQAEEEVSTADAGHEPSFERSTEIMYHGRSAGAARGTPL